MSESKGIKRATSKPRPLRGRALVSAAIKVLEGWVCLSPATHPINILKLSQELGVTRQALYNNGIKAIISKYKSSQLTNFSVVQEAITQRQSLKKRIATQDEEILKLRRAIDSWIEKWAIVEYNAKLRGINFDELLMPLSLPSRTAVGGGKLRKRRH